MRNQEEKKSMIKGMKMPESCNECPLMGDRWE